MIWLRRVDFPHLLIPVRIIMRSSANHCRTLSSTSLRMLPGFDDNSSFCLDMTCLDKYARSGLYACQSLHPEVLYLSPDEVRLAIQREKDAVLVKRGVDERLQGGAGKACPGLKQLGVAGAVSRAGIMVDEKSERPAGYSPGVLELDIVDEGGRVYRRMVGAAAKPGEVEQDPRVLEYVRTHMVRG